MRYFGSDLPVHASRSAGTFAIAAMVLLAIAGCTVNSTPSSAPTDAAPSSASQPAANGAASDPCAVITIADLEKLTGLSGLSAQPIIGSSKNGCHWGTPDGTSSVSYDVLPMTGTADSMIATIQNATGGKIPVSKVDLGNGHSGAQAIIPSAGSASGGTVDLFLPPDRYAAIIALLPGSADAASITLNLGKAFSAVADTLPAAPKM